MSTLMKVSRRCHQSCPKGGISFSKTQENNFLMSLWTASNQTGQLILIVQIPQIDKCSMCDSPELHPCQETFVTF